MMNTLFANSYSAIPMFNGLSFGLITVGFIVFFIWILAAIVLKAYALWNAAKRDEIPWFVALLILNTMGILELIYLYFIVKKWNKKEDKTTTPSSTPNEQ